jgi:hypothetical protein
MRRWSITIPLFALAFIGGVLVPRLVPWHFPSPIAATPAPAPVAISVVEVPAIPEVAPISQATPVPQSVPVADVRPIHVRSPEPPVAPEPPRPLIPELENPVIPEVSELPEVPVVNIDEPEPHQWDGCNACGMG